MRAFLRYLLCLVIFVGAFSAFILLRYGAAYPKPVGPSLDDDYKRLDATRIEETQPRVVLVGDSILALSVDPPGLAREMNVPVYGIGIPGSASAVWYLVIKNDVVPASGPRPDLLVLIARDTILTRPGYRVYGSYFSQIDEYATSDEPELIQRAYINLMNPLDNLAEGYFPIYGSRWRVRETLDYYLRYTMTSLLLDCGRGCTSEAMSHVFEAANMEQNILGDAVDAAETYLYTAEAFNFADQVDRSFLPEIIRLCKENGIQLVVVRTKTLRYSQTSEPAALKRYIEDLSAYLKANDVALLDFSHDPRIKEEYFIDPLHLNPAGRDIFTQMLAEALTPLLKK